MTIGAGHPGAWGVVMYWRHTRGYTSPEWHSGNFEYHHTGAICNTPVGYKVHPDVRPNGLALMRPLPLMKNELREIDIMEGWFDDRS